MKHLIVMSSLLLSVSAFANPQLKSARSNPLVAAALSTTAAEAGLRLSACSTTVLESNGDTKDGTLSFSFSCNNARSEYGVFSTVEGYFIDGKFYVSSIKVDRAG